MLQAIVAVDLFPRLQSQLKSLSSTVCNEDLIQSQVFRELGIQHLVKFRYS